MSLSSAAKVVACRLACGSSGAETRSKSTGHSFPSGENFTFSVFEQKEKAVLSQWVDPTPRGCLLSGHEIQ